MTRRSASRGMMYTTPPGTENESDEAESEIEDAEPSSAPAAADD